MKALPSFSNPPVAETVLSVSFAPIERLISPVLAKYWDEIHDEFPTATEHQPYDMPIERLDVVSRGNTITFQVGTPPTKTRLWLISADDQRLIQIQRDWFALNWRKRKGEYTRYSKGRADFVRLYEGFEQFVDKLDLGPVRPIQCEVIYINHIRSSQTAAKDAASILAFLDAPSIEPPADRVEMYHIVMSFLMKSNERPIGRLHLSLAEQIIEDDLTWVLNLTARGAPEGDGLAGIMEFFDFGREAIVLNFKALTTNAMHEEWGLQ